MTEALINREILRWARERAALPFDVLADKIKTKVENIIAWESGAALPTFQQAEKFAGAVHVPFGFLFLPRPPVEELPIPDLRTPGSASTSGHSPEFLDLIRDVMFQWEWFRDYLNSPGGLDNGAEPLPFVGKFLEESNVQDVARDIRATLGLNLTETPTSRNWEDHLNDLFDRCEQVGVWVMRRGIVGSNTHRTLSVAEFRGFAISDAVIPLVFINGRDAKAAQAFTLAHELAHVWLGQSGISNSFLDRQDGGERHIEKTCNAIAAEVLVPRAMFIEAWSDRVGWEENCTRLAQRFKVSRVVLARRAFDLGKITWDQPDKKGGGDFYRTALVRNGKRFTRAVLSSAMSGALLLRDAGGLLHMKPATLGKLYKRQEA